MPLHINIAILVAMVANFINMKSIDGQQEKRFITTPTRNWQFSG
jgi:hypothetical protein